MKDFQIALAMALVDLIALALKLLIAIQRNHKEAQENSTMSGFHLR